MGFNGKRGSLQYFQTGIRPSTLRQSSSAVEKERKLQNTQNLIHKFPCRRRAMSKVAMNNPSNHRNMVVSIASLKSLATQQLYLLQNAIDAPRQQPAPSCTDITLSASNKGRVLNSKGKLDLKGFWCSFGSSGVPGRYWSLFFDIHR